MLSPANGATGVAVTIGSIYFAVPNGLPGLEDIKLTTAGGVTIFGGSLSAAPSPLPSGVSSSAGPVYVGSVPTLASGTTYTVSLAGIGICPLLFGSSGSFTTQ